MKEFIIHQVEKFSNFCRGVTKATGVLFGVRQEDENRMHFGQLVIAGGVFLFGVPIGLIFFGSTFSLPIWLAIVLTGLMAVNIDQMLLTIATMTDYGV